MAANIIPTPRPMLGGSDAVAGVGAKWTLTVASTWVTGDKFTIVLTNIITGQSVTLGAGLLTGQVPVFALTYKNKLNLLFSSTWVYSAVGDPTEFNDLAAVGNGFVTLTDAYSESDTAKAIAPYQGRLAVFGQNNIQIWQVGADPIVDYQLTQILENVGTFASLSVKAFGELDVFFLHRTGVRSLRVRDASSNAYMSDVGSPIDFLVRDKIADASTTERSAACSIIELGSSQYWLFLKDTIYVLSYFPSAKITAWSTFLPTYQTSSYSGIAVFNDVGEDIVVRFGMTTDVNHAGSEVAIVDGATSLANPCSVYLFLLSESGGSVVGTYTISGGLSFSGLITLSGGPVTATYTPNQTAFVPQKFVNYNGLVIARASDGYYVYGGATGETYDNTICAWETSWLDSDSPANDKQIHGMDVAQEGTWNYYGSVDYLGGLLQRVLDGQTAATFDGGKIDWSAAGTHMKMRGQTTGLAARSVVSNLLFHYKGTKIK